MLRRTLVSLAVALGAAALSYLVSDSFALPLLVGPLLFLSFFFLVIPPIEARILRSEARGMAYRFVSGFLISLSVSKSLEESYDSASAFLEGSAKEASLSCKEMEILERLRYLRGTFRASFYDMFCSMMAIWQERGGDVLDLMDPLLREATSAEEAGRSLDALRIRQGTQFLILWGMSLLVLLAVRLGLSSFYETLSGSLPFLLVTLLYFLALAFAFVLFARIVGDEPNRGDRNATKKRKPRKAKAN